MGDPRFRRALRSSGAATLLVFLGSAGAHATDWSLTSNLTQTFSAESNATLDPNSNGGVFGSVTGFNLGLQADTKLTNYQVTAGAALRQFVGPGDDGTLDSIDPNFNASFVHNGKRTTLNGGLFLTAAQTSFTQIQGRGARNVDARQIDFGGSLGATRSVDERNTLGVSAFANATEFTRGNNVFDASRRYGVSSNWNRNFTENVTGGIDLSVDRFTSDAADDPVSWSVSPTVNTGITVNSRLNFALSGGAAFTTTERTIGGARFRENNVGGIGNVAMNYDNGATTVGLTFGQSLVANSNGALDNVSTASFSLGHAINSRYSVSLGSSASRADTISGFNSSNTDPSIFFSVGPSISYQVTRDWSASLGYNFVLLDDSGGTAVNNGVFLSFGRSFNWLP